MKRPIFDSYDQQWAERVVGRVAKRGIDGYLALRVTDVGPGWLLCEMPVTDDIVTPMGNVHGGCLSALCDHALGVVMYPVMPEGYWAATTEFKLNLLAPVTQGVCVARAEIISMSRRLAVVRIDVENEGRMVAAAQGTCTIVAPKRTQD